MKRPDHDAHAALVAGLTRRDVIARAATGGAAALVLGALPVARELMAPQPALAATSHPDGTLQAFYDTIIPGRKIDRTERGDEIHPQAIAGADRRPGAVEGDALAFGHHPLSGFDALEPAFLTDLEALALPHGGDFLGLGFDARVATCIAGLDFGNPLRVIWEAAAAVAFAAFCGAGVIPEQTAEKAVGYAVMGLPGRAPNGYWNASYRRRLSRERTRKGYLP